MAEVVELPQRTAADGPSLVAAVRAALEEAGAADTWEGRNALLLAERLLWAERESGSAVAALSAKLESAMEAALRPRPGESWADELREAARLRRAGGRR